MPFSQSTQLSRIAGWLEDVRPVSLLDVGMGLGAYGFLARIFLDGVQLFETSDARVAYRPLARRPTRIDGIEGCREYANPVHEFVYNRVWYDDALSVLAALPDGGYEVVLAIDILEHFDHAAGARLLVELARVARRAVLVSTPKTFVAQSSRANPLEDHRSAWDRARLAAAGFDAVLPDPNAWIAVLDRLRPAGQSALETGVSMHLAGRLELAERFYRQALGSHDATHASHLLALLAMQRGDTVAAVNWAESALAVSGIALPGRAEPEPVAAAPLLPVRTGARGTAEPTEILIEMTERCNLRCGYCALAHPDYVGGDLAEEHFVAILEFVRRHHVALVNCNGHGETTLLDSWRRRCAALLDSGARLNLISNFARRFDADEIGILARFTGLRISVDTADRALLKTLRPGADFRLIVENLLAIRGQALVAGRAMPAVGINCVVSEPVLPKLAELVAVCVQLGIADLMLHDVAVIAGLPDCPRALAELDRAQGDAARAALFDALALAQRLGLPVRLQESLRQFLLDPGVERMSAEEVPYFKPVVMARVMTRKPGVGETRHCLDPWRVIKVDAAGRVMACCIGREAVGDLGHASLDAIWQGPAYRDRRERMLSGDLPEECRICPARPVIARDEFRALVAREVSP